MRGPVINDAPFPLSYNDWVKRLLLVPLAFILLAMLVLVPSASALPHLERKGDYLYASGKKFTPFGYFYMIDYKQNHIIQDYFRTPTKAEEDLVMNNFYEAKKYYGANTIRIFLDLPIFMPTRGVLDKTATDALKRLLSRADAMGIYLVLTGNTRTEPAAGKLWYESLPEGERWNVQADFWRQLAGSLKTYNNVAWYELINEPAVPTAKTAAWHIGALSGYTWSQNIVLDPRGRNRDTIARDWTRKMATAVKSADPRALTGIGLFSFTNSVNAFRPEVVQGLIDVSAVHEYPSSANVGASIEKMKTWDARSSNAVVIGEVAQLSATIDQVGFFLYYSRGYLSGYLSHYNGQVPAEGIKGSMWDDLLNKFLALKPSLCSGTC